MRINTWWKFIWLRFCIYLLFPNDQARPNDALLLSTLLQLPLSSLRSKGFPVDRLLRQQQTPTAEQSITKPPRPPPHSTEQPPPQYEMSESSTDGAKKPPLSEQQTAEYMKQLMVMFPDCDPAYLHMLLHQEKDFEGVVDILLAGEYPKLKQDAGHRVWYGIFMYTLTWVVSHAIFGDRTNRFVLYVFSLFMWLCIGTKQQV